MSSVINEEAVVRAVMEILKGEAPRESKAAESTASAPTRGRLPHGR